MGSNVKIWQSSRLSFLFILLLTGLIKVGILSSLYAQPGQIHLSLADKRSARVTAPLIVTWGSDNDSGNQYVKYGLKENRMKAVKAVNLHYQGALFSMLLLKI